MADGSFDLACQSITCFGVGDIEFIGPSFATCLGDSSSRALRRLSVQIGHDDSGPFHGEPTRNGGAVPLTGARDKCNTPFKQHLFRLPDLVEAITRLSFIGRFIQRSI